MARVSPGSQAMKFIAVENFPESQSADLSVVMRRDSVLLLCREGAVWQPLPAAQLPNLPIVQRLALGLLDNRYCDALVVDDSWDEAAVPGYHWVRLRDILNSAEDVLFQLAGRAVQLQLWLSQHQFCGRCGAKTRTATDDRSLLCEPCDLRFYPKISPCAMVLITRGQECLLARGVRHPEGLYSALAGFVEAGEAAEQTAEREVFEEVGLQVSDLRYFSSQAWPFPGQLMIAYTAKYASGEINIDPKEILDARWFRYDSLPLIPPKTTIAGRLIDSFVASCDRTSG